MTQKTNAGAHTLLQVQNRDSPGPPLATDLPFLPVQKHLEKQPVFAMSLLSKITPSLQGIWCEIIQPPKVLPGVIGMFLNKLFLFFGPEVDLASPRSISLGWILCRNPEGGKVLILMEETSRTHGEKTQKQKQGSLMYPALLKAHGSWHHVQFWCSIKVET